MRNLPFVRRIRYNQWNINRDIERRKEFRKAEKALTSYLELLESENLSQVIQNRLLQGQNNTETISAIKWELQGIKSDIERITSIIEYLQDRNKIRIPLG